MGSIANSHDQYGTFSADQRRHMASSGDEDQPYAWVRVPGTATGFITFLEPVGEDVLRVISDALQTAYKNGQNDQRMNTEEAFRGFLDSFQDPRQPLLGDPPDPE